ncbi:hypothetical protein T459_03450 [Capsicum annuum]|uniref:Uncharacterized protein n=1 Tax=Capsicum annuum TaxID=4072 RepID=A0A2G3AMX0_CAPAN|nr:hypothetical protein T459_03450 [Capsicum annuum]
MKFLLQGKENEENVRWNKLQDVIPPEIGELKQLAHLYLSFNNFKGEIPKELANLPELRYLHLHENHFTGRIPLELGTLQHLRHLDVGNNRLVGTIRELIRIEGYFPLLCNLYLNNNYLTGGVPAQLANLTNLEILYLSYNRMTGVIPYNIALIPKLTYSQVMRLVDPFRPWMQGDHVMIMILMTFFDFVAFVLDIQL